MLNQVEKNKILNSIKNNTTHKLIKTELVSKKWNINKCSEILDFLIYEIEEKLNIKRKKGTKTLSNLIYFLYVTLISIVKVYNKVLISEESYNKLLKLKDIYENNIENVDSNDINIFNNIYKNFKSSKAFEIEKNTDTENIEEESKIEPTNEEIDKLKNNLKEAKKKIKELNKTIKEINIKLESCADQEEVESYKKEIINLNNKINDLNSTISNLSSKNQSLESINESLRKQITDVTNTLTKKYKSIEDELNSSREKINSYDNEKLQKEYEEELDNLVLTYIADNELTIPELLSGLKVTYPNITKEGILESLKRLQEKYILTKDSIIDNEFTYKLGKKRNSIFDVKNSSNSLDIIVIADMHIDNSIDLSLRNLNYIYDYAAKNDIKTIINLGDIIDSRIYNDKSNLENLRQYEELLNIIIEKLPKDNNIINLLLGGNHDRSLLDLGLDVTDRIDKNRLDYINLGNDHAILAFSNSKVGLHHFNRRYENDFINIDSIDDSDISRTINDYYKTRNINKNDSFIDLLGHFHVSKLSIPNNYITVPSLNRDHIQNGAYRMKLYFDSNGNIVNSILIPLIIYDKVLEATSINYKKIK